jgi:hypothetical protein
MPLALCVGHGRRARVYAQDERLAAVGRPWRQPRAIRVSSFDEVDPPARCDRGDRMILRRIKPGNGVEIVEDIGNFAGVKGAGVPAGPRAEPTRGRQRRPVEPETEYFRASRRLLRLDPRPRTMDDREMRAEVLSISREPEG